MEALRTLILDDIINLIRKLYNHFYSHYDEFIEGDFNDMMEYGLVLDVDIIKARLTKLLDLSENTVKEVIHCLEQTVQNLVHLEAPHA